MPKYCDNGYFINNCSFCGCPSGQACQSDESCKIISGGCDSQCKAQNFASGTCEAGTGGATTNVGFGVNVQWSIGDKDKNYFKPDVWTLMKYIGATRVRKESVNKAFIDEARQNGIKVMMILGACPPYKNSTEEVKTYIDSLNLAQYRGHEGI